MKRTFLIIALLFTAVVSEIYADHIGEKERSYYIFIDALQAENKEDFETAIFLYKKLLTSNIAIRERQYVHYRLSKIYFTRKNYRKTIEHGEHVVSIDAKDETGTTSVEQVVIVLLNISLSYFHLGSYVLTMQTALTGLDVSHSTLVGKDLKNSFWRVIYNICSHENFKVQEQEAYYSYCP